MKKLLVLLVLTVSISSFAQILEPVKWSTSIEEISNTEYVLVVTATIDDQWHLYSQTVPEGGPIATRFTFEGNGKFLKKGNTKEEAGHTVDDPVFGMKIKFFETKALFKQHIKLKGKKPFNINATVEFMVCDDTRCLPPTEKELTFTIK